MNYREKLDPIMLLAGDLALSLKKEGLRVEYKKDGSPVTNADHALSDFLIAALQASFPGDGFLSEEQSDTTGITAERFWTIDPIDGTKHYVAGKDHWCVMIALVEKQPIVSMVYYPELGTVYYAEKGKGAYRTAHGETKQLHLRHPPQQPLIQHSKSSPYNIGEESTHGTTKHLLMIARGELDCFLQSEREYWDICPPALIVQEAGGVVVDMQGKQLSLQPGSFSHENSIAGHPAVVEKVVAAIKKGI